MVVKYWIVFLTKIKRKASLKGLPSDASKIWNNLSFETTDVYAKYADEYLDKHRGAF